MIKNVYIHIPFCVSKCKYCSFVSFCNLNLIERYIEELIIEIKKSKYNKQKLNTLYFGGGTPSLLTLKQIEQIIKIFNIDKNTEVTFEVNPINITKNYLENIKELGVNRLSIGAQSFNDNILLEIGRFHQSKDIYQTIEFAKSADIDNINLDLIYGLPDQNKKKFHFDLNEVIKLNINHISFYGLKIEKGCHYYKNKPGNLPTNDYQAKLYQFAINFLSNHFIHYEISNFAKKNYESKHNLNYWDNNNYFGFGLSASGYLDNIRYKNVNTLENYFLCENKICEKNILNDKERLEEEIFLGFRKTQGINVNKINKKYNIDFDRKYYNILKKFENDYIKKTDIGYKLTLKGILISNDILCEFIDL